MCIDKLLCSPVLFTSFAFPGSLRAPHSAPDEWKFLFGIVADIILLMGSSTYLVVGSLVNLLFVFEIAVRKQPLTSSRYSTLAIFFYSHSQMINHDSVAITFLRILIKLDISETCNRLVTRDDTRSLTIFNMMNALF